MPLSAHRGPAMAGSSIGKPAAIIAAFALLEVIAVGSIYLAERWTLERNTFGSFYRDGPTTGSDLTVFLSEGIRQPPTRLAEEARLDDSEEVIGLEVGGEARAYRLGSMRDRTRHIINDVVVGVPVTVTYCDVDGCIRGFTDPRGDAPLDISQGGLKGGAKMVIMVGGIGYLQDTGEPLDTGRPAFPYETLPATRTSWKSWREAHPHTDVYVGDSSRTPR